MLIDIVFLMLMLLAIFKGYSRGLIVAVFSILAFIIGLAAAIKLSALVAFHLKNHINASGRWMTVLSFALVFVLVVFLVRFVAALIERTMKFAMLGWVNKVGGIILYAVLYTIILGIVLFYANNIAFIKPETIQNSVTYNFVSEIGPWAINGLGKAVPAFKGMFNQLEVFFGMAAQRASG